MAFSPSGRLDELRPNPLAMEDTWETGISSREIFPRRGGLDHSLRGMRSTRQHTFQFLQFLQDHRSQLRDTACAQRKNHVSILGHCRGRTDGLRERTHVLRASSTLLANSPRKRLAADPLDRLFAGCINI